MGVEKTATITVSKTKLKRLIETNLEYLVGKGNEELLDYEVVSVEDKTKTETYLIGNFDADYVQKFDGLKIELKSK